MCRFEPPKTFKFPIASDLIEQFKSQVDEADWEERVQAVAALKKASKPSNSNLGAAA